MAIIYGRAESEQELLKKYPNEVEKIEDIPKMHVLPRFSEGIEWMFT